MNLRQVSEAAGVSTATVSRVLRGMAGVEPDTRERVMEAVAKLGYERDPHVARAMGMIRSRSSRGVFRESLAFLSSESDPSGPKSPYWLRDLYRGATERARLLGYSIDPMRMEEGEAFARRAARILKTRGQRGVILTPIVPKSRPRIQLPWHELFCVEIGHTFWEPTLDRVERSIYEDLAMGFSQLLARGYQRIGLAVRQSEEELRRWSILAHYLVFQHRHPDLPALRPLEEGWEWTAKGFMKWFRSQKPDAIVTTNVDAQRWLREAGVDIPGEVGVMRHDCVHEEDSGLWIDHTAMGSSAVDRVTRKIETGEIGLPLVPRCTQISHSWQEGRCLRPLLHKTHIPMGWHDY